MTRRRTQKAAAFAPQASFRRLLTVLVVLAGFLFQTYAVQTHIHVPGESGSSLLLSYDDAAAATKHLSPSSQHKKIPAEDPANCPLCQAMFLSGQFVMPGALVFLLPARPLSVVPLATALPTSGSRASHIWQGRAPPKA